jgi:hypothetical protein
VIILGPEGPSFRCCENRIPASGRQTGSIHEPFPEVPRLGHRAAFVSGALRGPWKVETHLDLWHRRLTYSQTVSFCGIRVGRYNQQVFGKTTTQALAF